MSTDYEEIHSRIHQLEAEISRLFRRYTFDSTLYSIWLYRDSLEPFVLAGCTLFAQRNCQPSYRRSRYINAINSNDFLIMAENVKQYSLCDPLSSSDAAIPDRPISILLRIYSGQIPFAPDYVREAARALVLYEDLPAEIGNTKYGQQFNFQHKFREHYGCSVLDYVSVAFVAYCAAIKGGQLTRGYFEAARRDGMLVPNDKTVVTILSNLAGERIVMQSLDQKYRQSDRRFGPYDFNPLFVYPIIRPWNQSLKVAMDDDRMIVPLPNMILWRICTGIYYDMCFTYKQKFPTYFGHIFEAYVGRLLDQSVTSSHILISEKEIRSVYNTKCGKAPDWIIIEGDNAILIECKTERFSQKALTTGAEADIEKSISEIRSGLIQIAEFTAACKAGRVHIDGLKKCTKFHAVIITLESMVVLNAPLYRYGLASYWGEAINELDWGIVSVGELEPLQPHFSNGLSIARTIERLRTENASDVFEDAEKLKSQTFADSFLYQIHARLYTHLGVPD